MIRGLTLTAVALALLLAAAAHDVGSAAKEQSAVADSTVSTPTAPAQPDSAAAAALAKVRAVFSEHCIRCHGSKRPAAGLALATEADLAALAKTASAGRDTVMLVAPGRPEASYLLMKIKGSEGIIGNRMPLGAKPLSDEDVGIVEEWIRSLAVPDTTTHPTVSAEEGSKE
jgi:mono/diheme cytochrome c family protein